MSKPLSLSNIFNALKVEIAALRSEILGLPTGGTGSGEANTASNLGGGGSNIASFFASKFGVDLRFRKAKGINGIVVTEDANYVIFDGSGVTGSGSGGASATNLDGLTDVVISSPQSGQILKYNGSQFINTAEQDITAKANDSTVVHKTGTETIDGAKTFTTAPVVPADAYNATNWDNNFGAAAKNDVRDKIEAVITTIASAGGGDMTKAAYDTNNDGKVNSADNADNLSGQSSTYYRSRANHTGTQAASTISDFSLAADTRSDARIAAASINALADVTVTSPTSGQVLKWNGSQWINDTDVAGSGGGGGDMLKAENLGGLANYSTARSNLGLDTTANLADTNNKRFVTDAEKSTWNSKQAALGYTPENAANKGQANGYAGLGSDGKVPAAQLPSASGSGDMLKSAYDTTNDGKVDTANNSDALGGLASTNYATKTYVQATAGMPSFNFANYGSTTANSNSTALTSFFNDVAAYPGSLAYIPPGIFQTDRGFDIPANTNLECVGSFKLTTNANTDYLARIQGIAGTGTQYKKLKLRGLKLDIGAFSNTTCLRITGTGSTPMFNMDIDFLEATATGAGSVGVDNYSVSGAMEAENLRFKMPLFLTPVGYRSNSENNSTIFERPMAVMPSGGLMFDILSCGYLTINGYLCTGTTGYSTTTGRPTDGSCFLKTTNVFNTIRINGGQDERVEYFLIKAGGNHPQGAFIVEGGALIQSKVYFGAGMTYTSKNNTYICGPTYGTFEDAASAGAGIKSENDYFENRIENGTSTDPLASHNATRWASGSTSEFITRSDRAGYECRNTMYQTFALSPGLQYASEYNNRSTLFSNKKRPVASFIAPDAGRPLAEFIEASGHGWESFRNSSTGVIEFISTQQLGWSLDGKKFVFNSNGTVTWV